MLTLIAALATAATQHSTEWWLTFFTGALVFATLILVVVAFLQFLAMQRQESWMERSVETAEKSANAAKLSAEDSKQSADAAEASVQQMKENARKQLRARVFVASANRLGRMTTTSFVAEITVKNFGHIPAYACTCTSALVLRTNPPGTDAFPTAQNTGLEPSLVLPPDGEFKMINFLPVGTFQTDQHNQVFNGTHAIYFYGTVRYRDGFGRKRFSKFRLKCCGTEYNLGRFSFCEEGNKAN